MAATVVNLTSPGQDPVDGDLIRLVFPSGAYEEIVYHAPVVTTPMYALTLIYDALTVAEQETVEGLCGSTTDAVRRKARWFVKNAMRGRTVSGAMASTVLTGLVAVGVLTEARRDEIVAKFT